MSCQAVNRRIFQLGIRSKIPKLVALLARIGDQYHPFYAIKMIYSSIFSKPCNQVEAYLDLIICLFLKQLPLQFLKSDADYL